MNKSTLLASVASGALAVALAGPLSATRAHAATQVNPVCPSETAFFDPGRGEDIYVPPGYKIEPVAVGLNFPTNIAFQPTQGGFLIYVTEAGRSLPSTCNDPAKVGGAAKDNPFLADVRVLDQNGNTVDILGKAPDVSLQGDKGVLHGPTIGLTFDNQGRLFVSDSLQQEQSAGPKNSSRIVQVDKNTGAVTEMITGLPTGDHPTEQLTVNNGFLYWSQGSATNSGVVGHDNGASSNGGGPDFSIQHDVPCQDVILSGNNFDSGDGHTTAGYSSHGVSHQKGDVISAFDGGTQPGMCTGAILRAKLDDLQHTVEPVSWGYRNPYGIRFAPADHPLAGALLVTENGEDERGARPTNGAPDRIQLVRPKNGLDYHGWPDRFGFLASTQAVFNPVGGPSDDNPSAAVGKPVLPVLAVPPQPPVAPIALDPADVAVVGHDFAPASFAGAGNAGDEVNTGDDLISREGDFGFSAANGEPEEGHDIERLSFLQGGNIHLERFIFNCAASNQVQGATPGTTTCTDPADQAFSQQIHGINRPTDGKFGPDGAYYLVDYGAVRDVGQSDPDTKFVTAGDGPLVQIPGTGVIWKISKTGTSSASK